jgi:hypothetical protein
VYSGKNGSQFLSFALQCFDAPCRQQSPFFSQFEPKKRFVGFFECSPDLINPIGRAARATSGAIARRDCSCRPQDLIGDYFPLAIARQRIRHFHHPQCKLLRSCFKFLAIHLPTFKS